jgi:BirA family biotin operon repressor/biotin-[acetyl-CoA-carboxylase] ligase
VLPAVLQPLLQTAVVGHRLFFYPETDSTNDLAVAAARGGEPEGSVFYTDFQRRGRGRQGHVWESRPGRDLLFSVVLRPPGQLRDVLPVTLAVSLAFSVALGRITATEVGVKWPNDLVTGHGKLGGILAESGYDGDGGRFVVVGAGINVNTGRNEFSEAVRDLAASCRTLTGAPVDRAGVLADLLIALDSYYARFRSDGFGPLVSSYEERMALAGRRVCFDRDGERIEATVAGVAADGALRVDTGGGEVHLYNETVEVVE